MIKVTNLNYKIDSRHILHDVSFKVATGEIVAVVGQSGSGKTTLLNLLAGFILPNSGEILIDNIQMQLYNSKIGRKVLNESISIIFQNYLLMDGETVKDNFDLLNRYFKSKYTYNDILSLVGLNDSILDKPVSTLSGGEQQRIAIARAILKGSKILLADEPTGNLDDENRDLIFDIFKNLCDTNGMSILIITHDKELADRCNHVVSLDRKVT